MNLNELLINLTLAILLSLTTLTLITTLSYHAYTLHQKITLEDNALKAILTLSQNINSSRLDYCAPIDEISNRTNDPIFQDIKLRNNYEILNQNSKLAKLWNLHKNNGNIISDPLIITHQRSNAIFLNQNLSAQSTQIKTNSKIFSANQIIILDDCQHAVLDKIKSISANTITLEQAPNINLEAPIIIGTLQTHGFYLGNDTKRKLTGLYYYNGTERGLIDPNITAINLTQNTITIKAKDHDQNIEFKHQL